MEDNQTHGASAWFTAIGYVVLGVTMLALLAEPLIASVQNFSEEAGISSFFISFILVPLATNFREATSAIKEASHKKSSNTSQTIYEVSHHLLVLVSLLDHATLVHTYNTCR